MEKVAVVIAVAATLVLVGTMLVRSHLGFDFTDEGFYLNSISDPGHFPVSPTQFGYIYHPLYRLLRGDVALLRQGNILISFCLAVLACLCLLQAVRPGGRWLSVWSLAVSVVAASSSLMIVIFIAARWLPTPSYNSLVFQSLLITSIGVCLAGNKASPASVGGWLLIGIGGGLAFAGKPTSAAALGAVTLCSLIMTGKLNGRLLGLSVLACALFVCVLGWSIEGSIMNFVADLYQSAGSARLLTGGKPGIFRYDPLYLENIDWYVAAFVTGWIVMLVEAGRIERQGVVIAVAFAGLASAVAALALASGLLDPEIPSTRNQGLQFLAPIFAAFVVATLMWRRRSMLPALSKQGIVLAVFFAGLPFVYAFGTIGDYWMASSGAAFFWTLSGISLIASAGTQNQMWRGVFPVAVVTLAMTVVFVYRGMMTPQRQTHPLTADREAVEVAGSGAKLLVSPDFARYINGLARSSRAAGFQTGTAMIDFSGHYPGALYLLGAKPAGAPWLIGGYPGSDALAAGFLNRASCEELARSWILAEPDGPRKLSADVLSKNGIDIARDYTIAAVLDSPTGTYPDSYEQQLLKPARPPQEAVAACRSARERGG